MERLELKYSDALKALNTLKDILREPFSVIVRDAAIQRFEYTFEAFWKFIREYLKEEEGIIHKINATMDRTLQNSRVYYTSDCKVTDNDIKDDRFSDTCVKIKEIYYS